MVRFLICEIKHLEMQHALYMHMPIRGAHLFQLDVPLLRHLSLIHISFDAHNCANFCFLLVLRLHGKLFQRRFDPAAACIFYRLCGFQKLFKHKLAL